VQQHAGRKLDVGNVFLSVTKLEVETGNPCERAMMRSYQRFWPSPKIGATYRAGDGAQSGQQAQAGAAMRS